MKTIKRYEALSYAIEKPLQEKVIFIVDKEEISLYQEALLHQSQMKAYIGIRVYTFDGYLRYVLKKDIPSLTKMQRYARILKCLQEEHFLLLKQDEQLSLVKKIDEACQQIYDQQLNLDIDISTLTLFSQHKLLDLKKLYATLETGYPDILGALNTLAKTEETLYLAHPENLTAYQQRILACLETKGAKIYHLEDESGTLPWQQALHQFLWLEQNASLIQEHPFWIYQASSKEEEVKMLCSDIAHLLDQGVDPDRIGIYIPDSQYIDLLYDYGQRTHLPITFKERPIRSLCFRFFHRLMRYFMEEDIHACFECLKIMGLEHPLECQKKMDVQYQDAFKEEENYSVLFKKKEQFHQATTLQEKTTVLESLLPYVIKDTEGLAMLETYLEETKQCDLRCSSVLYEQWLNTFYQDVTRKHKEYDHHVRLYQHQEAGLSDIGIQYLYFLGMNEGVVPATLKDHDLLLEEEKALLGLPLLKDQRYLQQQRLERILTQPVKRFVCSYATKQEDGTTLLPSSLCLRLKSLLDIPSLTYTMHPLFEEEYILKYGLQTEHQATFIKRHFQSEPLVSTACFHLDHPLRFSASQLECYNQCPFQYYLRYGMHVSSQEEPLLMPNEIGNMTHHVFDTLSDLFDTPLTMIEKTASYQRYVHEDGLDISACLEVMIQSCLKAYLLEHPELQEKIIRFKRNQALFQRLQKDLVLHLLMLHHQQDVSQFKLLKHEDQVYGMTPHGHQLYGRLDRLDQYQDYLRIIDYKSSQKKIDLNLVTQGFNIQMLLYLDLASRKYHQKRGVVSYYSSQPRIFKMDKPLKFEEILKMYAPSGYMLKDESLILAVDREIYDRPSPVYHLRYVKSRQDFSGDILEQETWEKLFDHIYEHMDILIEDIEAGKIDIAPAMSKDSAIMTKVNPCRYCVYHPICQRDFFYHEGKEIKKRSLTELGGKKDESIE